MTNDGIKEDDIDAASADVGEHREANYEAVASQAARVGSALKRGAAAVGKGVASTYKSIDPDLRWHAYQLPLVGLSMLMPRPRPLQARAADGHRPVVFVHGLGGHPGNFVALKAYFASRGRTRSYVVDFGAADTLEWMAYDLAAYLKSVIEQNGLDPEGAVDLVCHSMGGLVARLAMDDPGVRSMVKHVITLGTPHSGSHLARLAATNLTLALRPGSEIMQRLEAQTFWGEQDAPKMTAFWSGADTIVLHAENSTYVHAENVEIAGATHYGFLISPAAFRAIFVRLT
ncbi:MAG: alpha/beta fold hydrolase [Bradymonadaceae bacterium]|nr:alpha/beta fold hydrolase [Lujinxingiaceae bacterium]